MYSGFNELAFNTGAALDRQQADRRRQPAAEGQAASRGDRLVAGPKDDGGQGLRWTRERRQHHHSADVSRACTCKPPNEVSYDPEKAKSLLDAAGYSVGPDGIRRAENGARLDFRLFGRSDSPTSKKAVEYIKRYLADVGIAANVTLISEDALTEKIGQGEFDMFEWGWVVEPDPNYQLSTMTCESRSYEDGGSVLAGLSDSFYCNPKYDKLFAAQGSETDPAKRHEIVKQMQQILYDDWPYAVTYYYDNLIAYRTDRFEGFVPQPEPNGSYLFQYGTWTYENLKPIAAGEQSSGPSPALIGGIVAAVAILGGLAFLLLGGVRPGRPTTGSDWRMALISAPDVAPTPQAAGRGRVLGPGARFAVSRLLSSAGTLIFVILFNFFLFRLLPGDPIALYTRGRDVDPEIRRQMQAKFNAPIGEQFIQYIKNPFVPELPSQQFSVPVWDVIVPRIAPTLLLVGTATVLATIFGVWLGVRSAWKRGERFDKVATTTTLVLYSMPEFWFGMILLTVFSVGVFGFPGIFPVGGSVNAGRRQRQVAGILDIGWHLVLPVFTLTVVYLAEYALVMRASLIDEMGQDYLQTARAKGLRDDDVRRKHAVPNAMLPTTTLIFLNLGFVIGGAITIEYVFSLSGLGSLTVQALRGPDVPLLQTLFLLFSAAVIVANLLADLSMPDSIRGCGHDHVELRPFRPAR